MLTPVMNGDGVPKAILCVSREVTAERLALDSLKESEKRLAIAARAGRLGVWDYDIRKDELHCDDSWYRIMGRDPEPQIASIAEFRPFIHPEDVEHATDVQRTAQELIEAERDYSIEFRIIRPNGDIRWIRSMACLMQDSKGVPVRAIGFVVDITEAKEAEQKLRTSHDDLRQAEKLSRVGSWTWDIKEDHAVWSETLYEIFCMDPSKPAPRLGELSEIFTQESYKVFVNAAKKCVEEGASYSIDLEGVRCNGSHCYINARGEPVRNQAGAIVQVRGPLADITERKNAENHIKTLGERVQLAVEASGVGIWEIGGVARSIFLWDEQMYVLYGVKPGEFDCSYEAWCNMLHPDDLGHVVAHWEKAMAEGDGRGRCLQRRISHHSAVWRGSLSAGAGTDFPGR